MKKVVVCMLIAAFAISVFPIKQIETKAENAQDYEYNISNETVVITKYTGNGGDIVIPSEIDGYEVSRIDEYAFGGCTTVTGVDLPESLISIGVDAFNGCENMVYVNMPEGMESIERQAFAECKKLEEANIPDSVTRIGYGAFVNCLALYKVHMPKSLMQTDSAMFYGCEKLETINIPYGLKSIGPAAFVKCVGLKNVSIPDSVTSIGSNAFSFCEELESVILPRSVTTIEGVAFAECASLNKIVISKYIENIGENSIPNYVVIYGYAGTAAETYAEANGNEFVAIEDDPSEVIVTEAVENNGYQMNVTVGGVRTIYSVEPEIYGQEVVEKGLLYGLKAYASEEDMLINEQSDYVINSVATNAGLYEGKLGNSETAESYVMTFSQSFDNTNIDGMNAEYYVRVYAKLSDGTCVYSPIDNFSIYGVAKYLYDNELMNGEEKHNCLYDKVLSFVNPEYTKIVYSQNNSLAEAK